MRRLFLGARVCLACWGWFPGCLYAGDALLVDVPANGHRAGLAGLECAIGHAQPGFSQPLPGAEPASLGAGPVYPLSRTGPMAGLVVAVCGLELRDHALVPA